ncbi:MAG: 4-hydroxy-tetrahydrodipicolinate reductase [bacterium]|nr:MAG: 4-hydroxy-tetrahydrodipicolinate reductase [bacterium]
MIRVIVNGACGRMGGAVIEEIALDEDLELVGAIEAPGHPRLEETVYGVTVTDAPKTVLEQGDVVVDFTNPEASLALISDCADAGRTAVIGTTGFTSEQLETACSHAARIPLLISPNMSLGVNLIFKLVGDAAAALPDFDAEVLEIHHNRKKDSPSGTAARIAEVLASVRPDTAVMHGRRGIVGPRKPHEIGMHSLRGGDVVGEHTVVFAGEGERVELTHRAHSRRTFARGTIRAIHYINGKKPGLYTMNDVLGLR